ALDEHNRHLTLKRRLEGEVQRQLQLKRFAIEGAQRQALKASAPLPTLPRSGPGSSSPPRGVHSIESPAAGSLPAARTSALPSAGGTDSSLAPTGFAASEFVPYAFPTATGEIAVPVIFNRAPAI